MPTSAKTARTHPNPDLQPANHFELRRGRSKLTYTATNLVGRPQINYRDGTASRTFTGEEIRQERSALGTLLTVELQVILDGPTHLLTLVLPEVLLQDGNPEKLQTPVVFHTIEGSIAGRPLHPGPVQTYDVKTFRGTASFVLT